MPPPKTSPLIFVNTDNSNPHDKLFQGVKAGAKAEGLMQKTLTKIIEGSDGFTTKKSDGAKGFTIRLTVSAVNVGERQVKCTMTGSIEYYPPQATKSRGKGSEMLSTGMTSSAAADGTSESAILDCIEATTEALTNKSIPVMKSAYNQRYGN
jgi:hypothetical protein